MKKIRITADINIPFLQGLLDDVAEVTFLEPDDITRDTLADADALITRTRCRCGSSLLEGTPVKFIATATIGTDHIDTDYCNAHGIAWSNAPGCNANSVVNYVKAALEQSGVTIQGKTIGIIGVGQVGGRVAQLAADMGMRVLLNDPPRAEREPGFVSLRQIQEEADIITIHTPLNKETYHLIDKDFLNLCMRKALIINAARGAVVDNNALLTYKGDVILDCWENEPAIDRQLLAKALIATPHIAGYSMDGKANGTKAAAEAVCRFFGIDKQIKIALPAKDGKPYDIIRESNELKSNPEKFEWFRNHYRQRRDIIEY